MTMRTFAAVGLLSAVALAAAVAPLPAGGVGASPKSPTIVSPSAVGTRSRIVAKPKVVSKSKLVITTKALAKRPVTPTTQVATTAPATAAPTTLAAAPSTTVAAVATTGPTAPTAPTTMKPAALVPFEVVSVSARADVAAGSTATFSIVLAQRGGVSPITLSIIGLPSGMSASIGPNPATGLAVVRIATPGDAVPADYPLRILGVSGDSQAWANVTLGVGVAATTTTPTTTAPPSATVSFGFTVTPDGKTLVTGGQVQYDIVPIYETGSNGSIEFFVSGLPDGVWFGFSEKVTTTKTTLWLSSTVPLKAGRYPITITGVAKGLKKSGEVTLVIG